MRFDVDAVSGTGFQAWVSDVHASSQVLDAATFAQLALPSRAKGSATYADVSGGLFEAIAAGHPPATSVPVARH
jgi:hypothetical protein